MVRTSTRMLGERLVVLLRWVPAHLPADTRLLPHGGDPADAERSSVEQTRERVRLTLARGTSPVRRILG